MDEQTTSLYAAAVAAREQAYAPYSGFKVGAALLTAGGTIHIGVNVENAAYGSTICAERTAICSAVAHGAGRLLAICVVTDVPAGRLSSPCGACCQVIAEFNPKLPLTLANLAGAVVQTSLDRIYTRPFTAAQLEEDDEQ